jgi:hypothetical protein
MANPQISSVFRTLTCSLRTRGAALMLSVVIVMVGGLEACGSPTPFPSVPPRESAEQMPVNHVTVGLRVALDGETASSSRVTLVAVVHDLDGEETVTELGTYAGALVERDPGQDELVHLDLVGESSTWSVSLIQAKDGFVDATRTDPSGVREVIGRIPVRANAPLQVSEPPVQTTR